MSAEAVLDAVRTRDAAALRAALTQRAEAAKASDDNGLSALMLAIYSRFGDGIALLLEHGALQSIHEAAALGDTAAVERLAAARSGAVHTVAPDGATPLHLAAHFGHVGALQSLLRLGADARAATKHGFANTPLHAAIAGSRRDCAAVLLTEGADPNARDGRGHTPLHIAAANGATGIIRLLLDAGADPQAHADGKTPHEVARERDEPAAARLLGPPRRRG